MVHWDRIDFKRVDNAKLDVGLYFVKIDVELSQDKFCFIHYFTDKEEAKTHVKQFDTMDIYQVVDFGLASFNEFGMLCPYITEKTAKNKFSLDKLRFVKVNRYTWCDINFDHVYYFNSLQAKKIFEQKFNSKPSSIRFLKRGGKVTVKNNMLEPKGW